MRRRLPPRSPLRDAPILSLEEARARRARARTQPATGADAAARAAVRRRESEQLGVLQDLLFDGRLDPVDLQDMIKLGIVARDDDPLPCQSPRRAHCPLDVPRAAPTCATGSAGAPRAVQQGEDPVDAVELRPCVVMGRELLRALLAPLWVPRG